MKLSHRFGRLASGLVIAAVAASACAGSAPTPGPPEFPLVACRLDAPGSPTAPPDYTLVPRGTIGFTEDAWKNLSPVDRHCGAQALRAPSSIFKLSSFGGEDRILWAATLARPEPAAPDPVPPTVTLLRLDGAKRVEVSTNVHQQFGAVSEQYRMMGNYGHDAQVGTYLMRIVSATGTLLAEGGFEIVP